MFLKRFLDLTCCLIGLVAFGPFMIIISLIIKLEDGGDIFFIQERLGLKKNTFQCLKFRTMKAGSITRVGKYLRNTGLDELAQILNILKGDMSVVGPRPLTINDTSRLGWLNEAFRWEIKPGMTGLAQVYRGKGKKLSLFLDKTYFAKQSFIFDVQIIFVSFIINLIGRKKFGKLRDFYTKRRKRNEQ